MNDIANIESDGDSRLSSDESQVPGDESQAPSAESHVPYTEASSSAPTLELRAKHPLAIRWMHWINFPVLFAMIWSGLMIYWADSAGNGDYPHQVYRVGIGGWTWFRLFPDGFYTKLQMPFKLAQGLSYHFFLMWLFAGNGILYVLYTAIAGEWRALVPNRKSFGEAWQVLLHDLHLSKSAPPQKKYNGAQRISYTAVVLMGLGSLITGLAIYRPTQVHWLTTILGGYEVARWFHFWLTMGYCVFFLIHVLQVARAGWNNFRSMVMGYELVPVKKEHEA